MSDWRDDLTEEELLDLLQSAVEERATPADSMVDMIMTGYDITNVDAQLAELVEDVRLTELESIRADNSLVRLVSFASGDLRFEFEIRPDAPEISGHLEPVMPGSLTLEQAASRQTIELGSLAEFEFSLTSTAPFRLRYQPPSGRTIVTEWILP